MARASCPVRPQMREPDPVHRSRLDSARMCTRHTDVNAVLRDTCLFATDPRKSKLSPRRPRLLRLQDGIDEAGKPVQLGSRDGFRRR